MTSRLNLRAIKCELGQLIIKSGLILPDHPRDDERRPHGRDGERR